jgi:hypothetical protein
VTLFHKRLLIFFSVALNIGFMIAVIVMMMHHGHGSHHRSDQEIIDIVRQLDLPEDRERAVMETIQGFRAVVDRHRQAQKQARVDIVRYLAQEGPVDRARLHRLTQALEAIEKEKNNAFETHFMDLRNQLGDEKGAHFFALLLTLHEPEDAKANR